MSTLQLSMEELKALFYKDKMKEERVTKLRNYYRNSYFTEQEKIEQRREHFNSETANNDDLSQEITEFEEEISNTRKIFRKISHSLQKPKNTFKKLFKELEQEQLIINHFLAEECKKHNIDPQMITLIPVTQDSEYGRSSIIYNQNLPLVSN
jgi:hypothetical protein